MRLPDTPEMKQIWNEIAPFLKITLKGMEIIEERTTVTVTAAIMTAALNFGAGLPSVSTLRLMLS